MWSASVEQAQLRITVRQLAERQIAPHAAAVDADARFPHEARSALAEAGLLGIGIPVELGGQGGGHVEGVIVVEEVARACASTALIPAVNKLGTLPLLLAGTKAQQQRWLPRVATGQDLISYCLSESGAGSDVAAMSTTARRSDGGWILNGTKAWVSNAGVSQQYIVYAKTDPDAGHRGITAFLVDKDDGLSFGPLEKKMGITGSPTRTVHLDDLAVADDRRIGDDGSGFAIAAQAVGIAAAATTAATTYVQQREQFGRPIASFQGVSFMLADMVTKTAAARTLTLHAAALADADAPATSAAGAMAKCFASDTAMQVTTDAVQLLGGYGYVKDFPVERHMRDAKITQIYEGTNQIQRVVISRELFRGHADLD